GGERLLRRRELLRNGNRRGRRWPTRGRVLRPHPSCRPHHVVASGRRRNHGQERGQEPGSKNKGLHAAPPRLNSGTSPTRLTPDGANPFNATPRRFPNGISIAAACRYI